jgi:hypothetical protein
MKFNRLNIITGWIIFAIASVVYLLTIEPTASFWDCGEFIATAKNMEIGHPPGASFWLLISKFFSLFAFGNVMTIAKSMNVMSALASGFTILFLFWSITHLARKIVGEDKELGAGELIAIMGAGVVGALAYTFSDSFWFSAVESEVYAMSSLFTAAVFWAILKWESVADEPGSDRWLILIAYLMGVSIGVHILNLLAIPAIVLVYYFKRYTVTKKGIVYAVVGSFILLGIVLYGVIQLTLKAASWFELFFVNVVHLPFNMGSFIFMVVLGLALFYGIWQTRKKGRIMWNTIFLMLTFIMIGYSSILILPIRSAANPPLDENNPDNTLSLLSYVNREVYGQRPLLYGEYYNAPVTDYKDGKNIYYKKDGKYEVADTRTEYVYDSRFTTFFPRMYNNQEPKYEQAYKAWGRIKGHPVTVTNPSTGKQEVRYVPTFVENMRFFFRYQLGYMYFRYFMWNFSGRQSDEQGDGSIKAGNWITGIPFIDAMRLGPQDHLPASIKNNKGHNRYFALPLLLGLLGAWFYYQRHRKGFWIVTLLFIMTGAAIIVYLNEVPVTPRERDYVYVGSFYAFAIFIGVGVLYLYDLLKNKIDPKIAAIGVSVASLLAVPLIMGTQNWDDHDRSGRHTAHDFAYDYLIGLDPNALIFTNGDNDTFPLWYIQEVEGVRTDVRVCCMPFLPQDWYIDQLKRTYYTSKALPISMTYEQYRQGKRGYIPIIDKINSPTDLKQLIEFATEDDPRAMVSSSTGRQFNYIPASTFVLPVDRANVLKYGIVSADRINQVDSSIVWSMGQEQVFKDELVILDILAHNNWERPMYYTTPRQTGSVKLDDYLELQGMTYKLIPIKGPAQTGMSGMVNTEVMYDNVMHKFKYTNFNNPKAYQDETCRRMMQNLKNNFNRLASALIDEGKMDKATDVLTKLQDVLPREVMGYTTTDVETANLWYKAGNRDKGREAAKFAFDGIQDQADYYFSLPPEYFSSVNNDVQYVLGFDLRNLIQDLTDNKDDELEKEVEAKYNEYYTLYVNRMGMNK